LEENSINKSRSILFNNQDEDSFIYYDTKESKLNEYKLPSAFTQIFLGNNNALFCAFDGALQNLNINNWEVEYKNNVKKLVKSKKMDKYFANPPYVHKVLFNENIYPHILIGLMNGTILCIDKTCKKILTKNVHNCNILDLKYFRENTLITLGKDYKVKFLDTKNQLETKFYIELEEPASNIETWDCLANESIFSNFKDLNIEKEKDLDEKFINNFGFNFRNEIFYIDSKSNYLRILNIN
jgi:hypothetical protein